ncbi:hypothetical protein HYH03_008995 [Edaphochlamys debaryana]|uniref:tRNA pseudouridine synthase n=1 Tax=Edaphochlamys debaryana TaxID=47281 RepID=A0A835XZ15_9CHLO|nr:hypothetical protein HYH03_008995 [Edaphochlamys debaryana]|eukprot:KAG2492841.1 hypothetical protein HYH03_008995 [Edaphochlamys debaryana]
MTPGDASSNRDRSWTPVLQAAAAGCCGAAAACLGKLPGAAGLGLLGRLLCYAALFTCNGAVMGLYLRSLQALPSTLATVLSAAANCVLTGLLGRTLYGEPLGPRWLAGVGLVLAGLALVRSRRGWQLGCTAAAAETVVPSPEATPAPSAPAPPAPAPTPDSAVVPGAGGRMEQAGSGSGSDPSSSGSPLGRLCTLSYRLILSYDGTEYCGWQLQPRQPTVQRCLEAALGTVLRLERGELGVRAAGRTDSGVHARGQVVQFCCDREHDTSKLPYKLNALLPHDIRVLRVSRTAPDFSVTCSPLGKTYHYSITNAETYDPLRNRYAMHVRKPLDLESMRTAAALMVGTHDFTQLSNIGEEAGRPRKRNPVKTLQRVDVRELGEAAPGGLRIEVEGNGFLYKMVRHISGVLVAVGEGKLAVAAVAEMLETGSNAPPGRQGAYRGYNVAPAKGLCLHQVYYPPGVDDPSTLLYPGLLHDEFGRLLEAIPDRVSDEE